VGGIRNGIAVRTGMISLRSDGEVDRCKRDRYQMELRLLLLTESY
jgi:hypothetical protein